MLLDTLKLLRESKFVVLLMVYFSFLMDNVLLTVVVPIIPDYLFTHETSSFDESDITNQENDATIKSLSPLQQKFHALEKDNGPLGALLASKAFVQLAFTPLVGQLTGIVGFNLPLLLGSCNMLLASLLFAYGSSYGMLVLARALHGSASAAITVSGMCLLAQTVPKDSRSKLMPIAFGGIALGVLVGYPMGGAAYQYFGKPAPFLFIAFFVSLNIALQIWSSNENDDPEIISPVSCSDWTGLLVDKQTLIATCAVCVCTSSMAVLEPCLPLWLLGRLNPPPTRWQLGAVFIPDSLGYLVGSHVAGLLPVKPWRVALSAMVLAGLSCCAIPLATSLRHLALPHLGLGLGVGAVDAALVPMLANLVDGLDGHHGQYGPVYALQQTAVNLAYSLGPLLGGEAVRSIGFAWLMRLVGLMNVLYCSMLVELDSPKENILSESSSFLPSSYDSIESGPASSPFPTCHQCCATRPSLSWGSLKPHQTTHSKDQQHCRH